MRYKRIAVWMLSGAVTMGGALTLAGAGVAAAAAPSSSGSANIGSTAPAVSSGTFNCANAPRALARIAKLESKAQVWAPKAEAREAKAVAADKTKVADRIGRRVKRVEALEARGTARAGKIQALCPGSSPTTGTSSNAGTTS
jgi:hypothetical protein